MVEILMFQITASKTMSGAKPDLPMRFDEKSLIKTHQTDNCLRLLRQLFYHGG
jgi:hypothetical protein